MNCFRPGAGRTKVKNWPTGPIRARPTRARPIVAWPIRARPMDIYKYIYMYIHRYKTFKYNRQPLKAWAQALFRAGLGPFKGLGLGPLGPPLGPKGAQGFSKFDPLSYFKAPIK